MQWKGAGERGRYLTYVSYKRQSFLVISHRLRFGSRIDAPNGKSRITSATRRQRNTRSAPTEQEEEETKQRLLPSAAAAMPAALAAVTAALQLLASKRRPDHSASST